MYDRKKREEGLRRKRREQANRRSDDSYLITSALYAYDYSNNDSYSSCNDSYSFSDSGSSCGGWD